MLELVKLILSLLLPNANIPPLAPRPLPPTNHQQSVGIPAFGFNHHQLHGFNHQHLQKQLRRPDRIGHFLSL